jgi:hypothetical protein
MATKQFWTLNPDVYGDIIGKNTAEDIACPTIRVLQVTERRTPVYEKGKVGKHVYTVTPHHNEDHDAFLGWLIKENHKRKRNNSPALEADAAAAELFLNDHPIYRTKRGLRWQLKSA